MLDDAQENDDRLGTRLEEHGNRPGEGHWSVEMGVLAVQVEGQMATQQMMEKGW